ncbi:unnamed protein product [Ectocarpus sp. 4 AP-2014]
MGAQYSTGTVSADWKGWLEERCSLEHVRAIYNEFRALVSSRRDDDGFFINHRDFLKVFGDVSNYPPAGQGAWQGNAGGLRVNRKLVRPVDAERHRRMHLDKCFSCFDVLERGRVPSGMVWGGLALLTGAPELSKVKFIMGMYDADRDGMVNETELRMAMSACATGFCRLHRVEPPPDGKIHSLAQEAFLHQAAVAEALATRTAADGGQKTADEETASATTTATYVANTAPAGSVGSSGTGPTAKSTGAVLLSASISAVAVSSFCCANSRCRNFLKGVGAAGSADLVLLYRHEHELLRELSDVDSALDDYDRRAEYAASEVRAYATERGGDARRLVVARARVRALAEKWGVGRILEPAAIRALLKERAPGGDGNSAGGPGGLNDGPPFVTAKSSEKNHDKADPTSTMPAASQLRDGLSNSGGGGRRISWVKPLGSPSTLTTLRANAGVERVGSSRSLKAATALGWSDGFASLPEVQMQVLAEVGRLVGAAAKKGIGAASGAQSAGVVAAAKDAQALEDQNKRRSTRRAERERGIKERAREAAANLGRGEWKASRTADSTSFARAYKLGISKRANQRPSEGTGGGAEGGMRLAALARGGEGRASLSGGEMRSVRDWELLKAEHAAANGNEGEGEAEKDTQWTAPFAARLDVDTLEDLVEGAGGFVTDREAEEALADGGDLEKDQLGRVTLLGFIRWCRLREKRRLEADARRHNPPPPWKERLKHWRKVWNEGVILELARLKRSILARKTLQKNAETADMSAGDNESGSLASSTENSVEALGPVVGGKMGGHLQSGRGKHHANKAMLSPEPRFSRFACSITIPRPTQHDGLTASDAVDPSNGGGSGDGGGPGGAGGSGSKGVGGKASSSNNDDGRGSGGSHANKSSSPFSTNNQTNTAYNSSGGRSGGGGGGGGATGTTSAAASAAAAWGSKIRLDVVRADAERGAGLTPRSPGRSPHPGGEGGGGTAAASARFDSPARELLQAYEDEQKKLQLAFWQEQGMARKNREEKAKAEGVSRKEREAAEAEEGRKAAREAPQQVKEMHAVAWLDMPFLAVAPPPSPLEEGRGRGRETSSATPRSARATSAAVIPGGSVHRTAAKSPGDGRGSLGSPPGSIETPGGGSGSGSGQTSLLAALAAERDDALELEAAEASAAERVAREFSGFFQSIPRDYRNELGFTDVLVTVVRIRYGNNSPKAFAGAGTATPRSPRQPVGRGSKSTTTTTGAAAAAAPSNVSPRGGVGASTTSRGARRVLRVAFFWERDPFELAAPRKTERNEGSDGQSATVHHPLADLVYKLTVQLEMTASMGEVLDFMQPWKNFKRRLYGPQEEELPNDSIDPRAYAREVLEGIEQASELLEQVPSMSFDRLRPVLAKHGLSEVGTLADLSARVTRALEGKIKGAAGGGALSKFGERAARMLFRAADKDLDGGLSYAEMVGMLRRMGMRATQGAMPTELDYLRTLKEMGVKTDRHGYLTEDGLVAFYRDFGRLGDDIEASGVASLNSLLGVKLSAVGQVDALAAKRLEDMTMEEHPQLGRAEKALSFLLRFAVDSHLDCSGESIAGWLAPADGDVRLKEWLLSPGWASRAVEEMQKWLADGDEGVIPSFRDAAAAAFGERWASAPSAWYDPGGDIPSFVAADLNDEGSESGSNHNNGSENGSNRSGNRGGTHRHRARSSGTTPTTFGGRVHEQDRRDARPRGSNTETMPIVLTTPPRPVSTTTVTADTAGGDGSGGRLGNVAMAPSSEPSGSNKTGGGGGRSSGGGSGRDDAGGGRGGVGRGATGGDADGNTTRRLHTTERNNAKDLAQYLGVSEEESHEAISGKTGGEQGRGGRGRGNGGVDGRELAQMDGVHEEGGGAESVQPHGIEDKIEQEGVPDLEDVFVEAGSLGNMKAALEKAKALQKAMLAVGLPSKIEEDMRKELEVVEEKARGIDERLQVATATAIARGLRAYDAARARLEGVATLGLGTRKVTARLQVTGFPIFSLLPAGMGEPMAGRLEEEAREARAETRRRVALDEIDRAKDRQASRAREEEERERKHLEKLRLKEEEKMKEEVDLYERGLSARQRATTRESEKVEAEKHWRRLVAIRQRRRKGTAGAAAAVNNLGVLLVDQSDRDSVHAAEGRMLLQAAVAMAEAGSSTPSHPASESKARTPKPTAPSNADPPQAEAEAATAAAEGHAWTDGHGESENSENGKDLLVPGGKEEWKLLLALFSSNLSFATEGPGRNYDHNDEDQDAGVGENGRESEHGANTEVDDEVGNESRGQGGSNVKEIKTTRCVALFEGLSPAASVAASGPSDSWECLGVGVTLFEPEDPFWWEREHPEDDEERKQALAAHKLKKSEEGKGLEDGHFNDSRREAVVRNRQATDDGGIGGGYTDLEVLDVIDPGRAARIRIRQTRHKAQQERRQVLLERRKKYQRQLRQQDKEAEAARAASAQAREAYHEREVAARRLKKEADERESRRQDVYL